MSVLYKCHFAEKLWYKNAKYAQLLLKMVKKTINYLRAHFFLQTKFKRNIFV